MLPDSHFAPAIARLAIRDDNFIFLPSRTGPSAPRQSRKDA